MRRKGSPPTTRGGRRSSPASEPLRGRLRRLGLPAALVFRDWPVFVDPEHAASVAVLEALLPYHLHAEKLGEERDGDAADGGPLGGDVEERAVLLHEPQPARSVLHVRVGCAAVRALRIVEGGERLQLLGERSPGEALRRATSFRAPPRPTTDVSTVTLASA